MDEILQKIVNEIIVPVIGLLFALALLYFLWGVVKYIMNLNNPTEKKNGQMHMFWGIIGLAIMLSAFGIIKFVFNTVTDGGKAKGVGGVLITPPKEIDQGHF